MMRLLLIALVIACSGCETVENAVQRHPVITTGVVIVGTAVVTGYLVQKRARNQFEAALAGQQP